MIYLKKYKLVKDLPGYQAGEDDFTRVDNGQWLLSGQRVLSWKWKMFDEAVDMGFFEAILDSPTRWRAENGNDYWWLDSHIELAYAVESGAIYDDKLYKLGNYFRAPEQAEAAAQWIKAGLEYIQAVNSKTDSLAENAEIRNVTADMQAARKLIQDGEQRKNQALPIGDR